MHAVIYDFVTLPFALDKVDDMNFRRFKDTTEVNFSCDAERNVIIVFGNNTYGKTTLLQAFNRCLYGKANLDGDARA